MRISPHHEEPSMTAIDFTTFVPSPSRAGRVAAGRVHGSARQLVTGAPAQRGTGAASGPSTRLRLTVRGRRVLAVLAALPAVIALSAAVIGGGAALASRDA